MSATEYIQKITLDEGSIIRRAPEVETERATAIRDLLESNFFDPTQVDEGPYDVTLSVSENRLMFAIDAVGSENHYDVSLSLAPFRRIIKDYFMICESYFDAVKASNSYKVEAVDMGRRGIHNEGSVLLKDLLAEKIRIDFDTARRIFTLICVLHIK